MAAVFASRKRCTSAFLDEPVPAPPHLAKRGRFSPAPAAYLQQEAASRVSSAAARANGDGMEECAGVLVDQMSTAADLADARARASAILKLIEAAVTKRAAVALREENCGRRTEALERGVAEQHRRQDALERDNGVLKHGVAALHRREEAAQRAAAESKAREEEAKRVAAELRKKVAELEAANYALAARMLGTDSCRFQAFHGPDVF
ncbi:unnamed protein product [Miscanthus lutarioriparius]|uniref:Uncharacterized protein n=1 Tax=Miscanthus lutarioriparius TaxID=422564 RepID=A0A811PVU6_9POAL|nr:unnamed protein product [Miscanthus lutarioriparius]